MESFNWAGIEPDLQEELTAATEEHMRSHPEPVQARFWVRRFLEDIPPGERAFALKKIYIDLRALWGDQDARGALSIDEALGALSIYRLWTDANRCSYAKCRHAELTSVRGGAQRTSGNYGFASLRKALAQRLA
jgi:hypothetical protein